MLPSGAPSARHKQSLQVLFYKCLHLCQTSAWHGADVQFFSARLISTLGGNICVWSDLVQSINNFSCKIKHVFIVFCCVQLFLWLFYCCFVVVIVFIIFVVFAIVCLFCVLLFLLCVFFIVFVIVVLLFFIFKYYLFFWEAPKPLRKIYIKACFEQPNLASMMYCLHFLFLYILYIYNKKHKTIKIKQNKNQ